MPRFIYTHHARQRMAERGISEAEVEQCVLHPTSTYQTGGANQYRATVGTRRLKVVVIATKDNDRVKVIKTAMCEDEEES
jgi:Domain of unknown function (DUF4258)